jgi:group I intron endonuclease
LTGKIYVGWTTLTLEDRWKRHLVADKKCYIQHCIKKYGRESFTIESLFEFENNKDAVAKEIEIIREWDLNICRNPSGNGMNMTDGGEGTIGYVATDEHRAQISKVMRGKKKSKIHIKNISRAKTGSKNPQYGRPHTAKQIEAARKFFTENNPNKKGKLSHMYGKPGYWKGKKLSAETKEKMRKSMLGKNTGPRSEEVRRRIGDAVRRAHKEKGAPNPNVGKERSDRSKAKMRAARLAYLEKLRASGQRYHHSEETKEKIRKAVMKKRCLLEVGPAN